MTTLMLIILSITIALFVWGKFPPDVVALMSMLALFLSGVLTLNETLSGFSNATVVMIGALFIIGEALSQTGWTALAGKKFVEWAQNSVPRLLVIITLGSSLLSGFVSNTGTVAALLPVTVSSAWNAGTLPSKLLMPVAFGSNTGGLLTLTGTPPNIITSNVLVDNGFAGFSFFEFSLIGLPFLLVSILYFRFIGFRLLPENKTTNRPASITTAVNKWIDAYRIDNNYFQLRIRSSSPLIGKQIEDLLLETAGNLSVIRLKRRHPDLLRGIPAYIEFPKPSTDLRYHDIITVKADAKTVDELIVKLNLGLLPLPKIEQEVKENLIGQEVGMAELLITPKSVLVGRTVKIGTLFERFNIQLIAASRNNQPIEDTQITVQAGDAYLIRGTWESIGNLKEIYENIVVCGSPESMVKDVDELTPKSYIALGTLVLMITLLVFKLMPGAIASMLCAGIVLLTGCVPISKAYKSISWTSVIMIAAMIPMGVALEKTGIAQSAANGLVGFLGEIHPVALLGGIFLLTTALSQTINNSATAVLMAPIALLAATSLGLSPKPFLITVAISASTAFLTPVGTTTNAMVLAAGNYKFMDYFKVGLPLLTLFFLMTLLLVPIIWPF